MVVAPTPTLGRYVRAQLPAERFEVVDVCPGPGFIDAVYRTSPHIAVLDRIEKRSEAATLELTMLKRRRPDVEVIVVSDRSSAKDASIVELGVFYYLAGSPRRVLIRLIEAAADALGHRCSSAKGPN